MPVDAGAVCGKRVLEGYRNGVAPVCIHDQSLGKDFTEVLYLPANTVGPGNWSLIFTQGLSSEPSGLHVLSLSSKLYDTVFPVVGHLASKSVAALKPLVQQARVKGPWVQAESGTLVDVGVDVAWELG